MEIKKIIVNAIKNSLKNISDEIEVGENIVSFSSRPELSDFQSNIAFSLAKQLKQNPIELANKIVDGISLETKKLFCITVVAPAFINFSFTDEGLKTVLLDILKDKNYGIDNTVGKDKTVVLDYGGANIAKELHMGHLRSPIIGESIKRLYNKFGYHTVSDVHLGDWGLQMGLVMAMLDEYNMLDYYYGKGTTKPQITLDFLNENYPKASKRSK